MRHPPIPIMQYRNDTMDELISTTFDKDSIRSGVVNDKILKIEALHVHCTDHYTDHKLDAIFFITLGYNSNLLKQVNVANKFTKNIIILTTSITKVTNMLYAQGTEIILFSESMHDGIFSYISSDNPSSCHNKSFDIPSKRNYAINVGRSRGLDYVGIFDDDIVINSKFIKSGLTIIRKRADIAASYSLSYPDISVIDVIRCKHNNEVPSITISGNSMFLNLNKVVGYFPYIYNEDWVFFAANKKSGVRICGFGEIKHLFKKKNALERVRFEQFGEIIAKSIAETSLMHTGFLSESDAYWSTIYEEYKDYLHSLLTQVSNSYSDSVIINAAIEAVNLFDSSDLCLFSQRYNTEAGK